MTQWFSKKSLSVNSTFSIFVQTFCCSKRVVYGVTYPNIALLLNSKHVCTYVGVWKTINQPYLQKTTQILFEIHSTFFKENLHMEIVHTLLLCLAGL